MIEVYDEKYNIATFGFDNVEELNCKLAGIIYDMSDADENYSMRGGRHTSLDLLELDCAEVNEFHKMISEIVVEYGNRFISSDFLKDHGNKVRITSWGMIYGTKDYSEIHTHDDAAFAITYHVQVPSPNGRLIIPKPDRRDECFSIESKVGCGVVIPGWLEHGTSPDLCSGTRITIAANVHLE
jgi:hypothetical protein